MHILKQKHFHSIVTKYNELSDESTFFHYNYSWIFCVFFSNMKTFENIFQGMLFENRFLCLVSALSSLRIIQIQRKNAKKMNFVFIWRSIFKFVEYFFWLFFIIFSDYFFTFFNFRNSCQSRQEGNHRNPKKSTGSKAAPASFFITAPETEQHKHKCWTMNAINYFFLPFLAHCLVRISWQQMKSTYLYWHNS